MTDLWPDFSAREIEENGAIELLRVQARLLERKTSGKVRATFSKIKYKEDNSPGMGSIGDVIASMVGEKKREVLEEELAEKTDANELYKFQPYKFEIYSGIYRFRVFVLRNRDMFPILLDIDEGIRSELELDGNIEIHSNEQLMEVVSNIFASRKLATIVSQMMAKE